MADLGKIGITYDKNGYVATTPYEPLTVLKYTDGGTYMSILPTTGHLPTDTTYWACMVPPIEASSIDYTPRTGGAITNTTVQGAIEQADSLKFNKVNVVQTNINHAWKVPSSALLYATKNEINDSLDKKQQSLSTAIKSTTVTLTFFNVNTLKGVYTNTKQILPVGIGRQPVASTVDGLLCYSYTQNEISGYNNPTGKSVDVKATSISGGFVSGHLLSAVLYYIELE